MEETLHPPFCGLFHEHLFSLETVVAAAQGSEDFLNISGDVLLGILEVIVHDILGIQAELGGDSGLGSIVNDQELISAGDNNKPVPVTILYSPL